LLEHRPDVSACPTIVGAKKQYAVTGFLTKKVRGEKAYLFKIIATFCN
jgi:hypothetical protein